MVYAVDCVIDIMKELSSSEPVLAQRGGYLYVASEQGFGIVNYTPQKFKEKRDCRKLTLENVTGTAKDFQDWFQKLPDYGNLSIVWDWRQTRITQFTPLTDKEDYLELIRKEEDDFFQKTYEKIDKIVETESRLNMSGFGVLRIPNWVIMTPYILVSFPQKSEIISGIRDKEIHIWTDETTFQLTCDPYEAQIRQKSHYAVNVIVNPIISDEIIILEAKSKNKFNIAQKDLIEELETLVERISTELKAVNSNMPKLKKFIDKINKAHNEASTEYLNFRKKLEEERKS